MLKKSSYKLKSIVRRSCTNDAVTKSGFESKLTEFEKHKTTECEMLGRKVQIDNGILSAVKWFNNQEGVNTLYSCEGRNNDIDNPYISFIFRGSYSEFNRLMLNIARLSGQVYMHDDGPYIEVNVFCGVNYCVRWKRHIYDIFLKNISKE